AAFGERAIDKTRSVIAVVLPEPAEATTEKLRSSSFAKRPRADSSRGFTISPTPLSRGRAQGGSAPIYLPEYRCLSAVSRAGRLYCNQMIDEFPPSSQKSRSAASLRDPEKHRYGVQDPEETVVERRS